MPPPQIFISYRRDDAAGYARAIGDALGREFGPERVFIDVDDIGAGQRFDEVIHQAVGGSRVLLVLIGRRWLGERSGQSARIHDPGDLVQREVAAALAAGMHAIPLLLDGRQAWHRLGIGIGAHPLRAAPGVRGGRTAHRPARTERASLRRPAQSGAASAKPSCGRPAAQRRCQLPGARPAMISHDVTAFGGPLRAIERPTPQPVGTQVLLRTLAAGVCHSDVHIWHGGYDLGHGKRLEMGSRGVSLPLTMGHEIVGEVVGLGPDARGVQVGQRVLVYPWIGCGGCAVCQRGQEHLCAQPAFLGVFRNGGYSSHVTVPHGRYLIDIGDMAPAQAAPYACSGLTAYSAIHKVDARVLADEAVVVIGAGGVGLMAVSLLGQLAGRAPVVIEPDAGRRAAALEAGAALHDLEQGRVVGRVVLTPYTLGA